MERLDELRMQAQALELDAGQRAEMRGKVVEQGEAYLEQLPRLPAFRQAAEPAPALGDSPFEEQGGQVDGILQFLRTELESSGVTLGSAGHMAFIPISTLYPAALGDYLAAVLNRYAGLYFASPGAVRIERTVLRWIADLLGYPSTAAGDLTSGGSMANLIAIVTARDAHEVMPRNISRTVVYLSDQTHHSVDKALRIAGLKECIQQRIPLDGYYRMQPAALDAAIRSDRRAGRIPWLIVGAAGTTDTGAVDLLPALAAVAEQHKLWLHIDAAYGGMFALCDLGKKILQGIELSDSLIVDPHKGLFMPCGSGVVLVKQASQLLRSQYYQANYMQDKDVLASPEEISPADLSPELTRPFRGLRLWLSLKLLGIAPFRAALEEKILLARFFYEEMQRAPGFEVGPYPDLSIVTFRYRPKRGDPNEFNHRLALAIQQDGRIFLSSTVIAGNVTLRLAVLNHNTHQDTVELAIQLLKEKAAELEAGGSA